MCKIKMKMKMIRVCGCCPFLLLSPLLFVVVVVAVVAIDVLFLQ